MRTKSLILAIAAIVSIGIFSFNISGNKSVSNETKQTKQNTSFDEPSGGFASKDRI